MKKALSALVIIGVVTVFGFSGCGKYEDGPSISLLTKKMRLEGDWTVEKYFDNGVDKTSDYRTFLIASETISVSKEGSWTYSGVTAIGSISFSENGTWEFANDKKDLTVVTTSNNPVTTDTWHILRLTNTEFWYYVQDSSGNKDEYHLKSK